MPGLDTGVTPAVRSLEAAGVPFTLHEYDHARRGSVEARGARPRPDQVFKTLSCADAELAVAIVPVSGSCR